MQNEEGPMKKGQTGVDRQDGKQPNSTNYLQAGVLVAAHFNKNTKRPHDSYIRG